MKLIWDRSEDKIYETGVDHGVLYPLQANSTYDKGVAWNGLSAVNDSPSGAEPSPIYADNIKFLNLFSVEEFGCTIEAYVYPDEFAECDGSAELAPGIQIGQQDRKMFGFSYRTMLGNEAQGTKYGYKIHLVYGCKASPSEQNHETMNDSPDLSPFSWEVTTVPVNVTGFKPTATLVIDSTKVDPDKLAKLELVLYGKDETSDGAGDGVDPRLPFPDEILTIIA